MMTSETLRQLFPSMDEIPVEQRLPAPIHHTTWRVDGKLKTWGGKCKTVRGPDVVVEHKSRFINTRFTFLS